MTTVADLKRAIKTFSRIRHRYVGCLPSNGGVELIASGDDGAAMSVFVKNVDAGEFSIGAGDFSRVALYPDSDAPVNISVNKSSVTFELGDTRVNIPRVDIDAPSLVVNGRRVVFLAGLRDAISYAARAAATDHSYPSLNGVFLESTPDNANINVVGSDGYRMHVADVGIEDSGSALSIIIPLQYAKTLSAIAHQTVSTSAVIGENSAMFELGEVRLKLPLLSGKYPDWRRIIASCNYDVSVSANASSDALRDTLLFAAEFGDIIRFSFEPERVGISSVGERVKTGIRAGVSGGKVALFVNAKYAIDAIPPVEDVVIMAIDTKSPVSFIGGEYKYTGIIMPVNLM